MAHLTDLDLTAPADSLYSGGVVLNTWRARIDVLNDALGDITSVEADQVENLGTTTISAAQWVYLGALDQSIISTASVDFGEVDITKTTTLAAGGFGLRSQVTHSTTGMTGTLRGAYIVATNAAFTATGTIRGAEIKARAATSGDVGGNVTTLEGVSISSDAKNKTVTTQRGMEVILDGKSGAAVTLGVGIRIANNYQANIATTSYALQIYRDSFDYTADIQLSGGGLIGGSTGKIKMDASGVTTLTASGNLDIGSYNFRAATLTADGLTSGRVVFASTSGLLTDDSDFTFATDTLTVTKIAAFTLMGKLTAGAVEIEGSAFDINGGTIDGVTIGGAAAPTVTNLGSVTTCDINGGTIGGITFDGALTMSLGSDADGDIYYRASNVLTRLAKGTATHVLTMNAGETAPEWAAAAGGGAIDISGTPVTNDYARWTDADTLEGREVSEVFTDLGLDSALANLTATEIAELEAIGDTTISAAQWGYLGACGAGGGQLLAALTTGESDQLELIGATTISATQWGYLGALTTDPLGVDGTAGRKLRISYLVIGNGTNALTLKCTLVSVWNGDAIAETDNVAKNATTGSFTLNADGNILRIEAAGLTGNCVGQWGTILSNASGTGLTGNFTPDANDIRIILNHYTTSIAQDMTSLVDIGTMVLLIPYITDA